jgi:hypothetical protein
VWQDGSAWLAYRLRRPVNAGRGYANVIARSDDGRTFETVSSVAAVDFGSASLERPALVRHRGGWRLYVSCSTPSSLHWWVEAVDADRPQDLAAGARTVVLPGDGDTAWKDPVVRVSDAGWEMWVCRHRIHDPAEADRMESWYATSTDGLQWDLQGPALEPRRGEWDSRGARITTVLGKPGSMFAFYDGRASYADNWQERTGAAAGAGADRFESLTDAPLGGLSAPSLRYVSVTEVPDGWWAYYELARSDGAHDLRAEYVPRPSEDSQSA